MSLFDHFRSEEKMFVERVLEWTDLVEKRHQVKQSNFLDPREQFIVQSLVARNSDLKLQFVGGYEEAERKRAVLYPAYAEVSLGETQVALLSVLVKQKKIPFSHRDILGALLGGGIKREMIGDILLNENNLQIIVAQEVADYLQFSLKQISRYEVSCELISWEELCIPEEQWIFKETTVSSLRLDTILTELLPFSRSKVSPIISTGKVKVNWKEVNQPSLLLQEGDILSVKGYGRFLFAQIDGLTKKEKYRVQLGKKA